MTLGPIRITLNDDDKEQNNSIDTPLVDVAASQPISEETTTDFSSALDQVFNNIDANTPAAPVQEDVGSKYDAYFKESDQNNLKTLKQNLSLASMNDADQQAEIKRLSLDSGLPPEMIKNNMQQVKRMVDLQKIDADKLAVDSPILAAQLRNPEFATLAYDDIEHLTNYEALAKNTAGLFRSAVSGVPGFSGSVYDILGSVPGTLNEAYKYIAGTDAAPLKAAADYLHSIADSQRALADWVQGDMSGYSAEAQSAYSGLRSMGAMAPGMYAFLVTGNPAFIYGGAGVNATGESIHEGLNQNLSESSALVYGMTDGGIEVLTEMVPAMRLFKDLKTGSPLFKTLMNQLMVEIPQEQLATVLQDLNAWSTLPSNNDKTFKDYLVERPPAAWHTLIATMSGTGAQTTLTYGGQKLLQRFDKNVIDPELQTFIENSNKAQEAQSVVGLINELSAALQDSKLNERSKETMNGFIKELFQSKNEDGSTPENVLIYAQDLIQYASEQGIKVTDISPIIAGQIDEAITTGGFISFPIETYLTEIANTDHGIALNEMLRLNEDSMSVSEANEWSEEANQRLLDQADTIIQEMPDKEPSEKIFESIVSQLVDSGVPREEANKNAALYRAFFTVMGDRAGIDPMQLFERYGLNVQRVMPEELQDITQSEQANEFIGAALNPELNVDDLNIDVTQEEIDSLRGFIESEMGFDLTQASQEEIIQAIRDNFYDPQGRVLNQAALHGTGLSKVFERFSMDYMGSGEGFQAFGYGLYFTSSMGIAEHYRSQNSDGRFEVDGEQVAKEDVEIINDILEFGYDETLSRAMGMLSQYQTLDNYKNVPEILKMHEAFSVFKEGGNWVLYDSASGSNMETAKTKTELVAKWNASMKKSGLELALDQQKKIKKIEAFKDKDIDKSKGRIYGVELAPKDDEWLLLDKSINDQSDTVTKAINKFPDPVKRLINDWVEGDWVTGQYPTAYELIKFLGFNENADSLASHFTPINHRWETTTRKNVNYVVHQLVRESDGQVVGEGSMKSEALHEAGFRGDRIVSEFLHSFGIRGNKYLSGESRNAQRQKLLIDGQDVPDFAHEKAAEAAVIEYGSVQAALDGVVAIGNPEVKTILEDWLESEVQIVDGSDYNFVLFSDKDVEITEFFQSKKYTPYVPDPDSNELALPYGRVESELQNKLDASKGDAEKLTSRRLGNVFGAPKKRKTKIKLDRNVKPVSYPELKEMLDWAIKNDHDGSWYDDFGKGFNEIVGEANLQEASILFGITSAQNAAETNFADTLHIMALARKFNPLEQEQQFRAAVRNTPRPDGQRLKITGAQIDNVVRMYRSGTYQGGLKVSNYMQVVRARGENVFNPYSVQDVHMARAFGFRYRDIDKKTGNEVDAAKFHSSAQIRYGQWLTSLLSEEYNMRPDQVQAYLWFYAKSNLSPKGSSGKKLRVGDGTFESAVNYAQVEIDAINQLVADGLFDKDNSLTQALKAGEAPNYRSDVASDPYTNLDLNEQLEALAEARAPRLLVSTNPGNERGFGFPKGVTLEQLSRYNNAIIDAITDQDSQIILLREMGIVHNVRTTLGTWERLEPTIEITFPGESFETASVAANILGHALMQDATIVEKTKWDGQQFGVKIAKADGSEYSNEDIAEIYERVNPEKNQDGINLTLTGDRLGIKILDNAYFANSESYDTIALDKFRKALDKHFGTEFDISFISQESEYHDHTRTSEENIRQVWDKGGTSGRSDLQRAAVNTLYKPIQRVYSDFRYKFRATSNPLRSPLGEIGWSGRRDAAQDKSWNAEKLQAGPDGRVNLTHWSSVEGITQLDPSHQGEGAAGTEAKRFGKNYIPRIYFGLEGYRKEQQLGNVQYTSSVAIEELYDWVGDPIAIKARVVADNPGFTQVQLTDEIEQAIKNEGYKGYFGANNSGPIAIIWDVVKTQENKEFFQSQVTNQINTPEFKEWFGNSKIVDENGDPKVVYHSTDSEFDTFKTVQTRSYLPMSLGFHFAENKDLAHNASVMGNRQNPFEMEVYLNIENPLTIDNPPENGWHGPELLEILANQEFLNDEEFNTYMDLYEEHERKNLEYETDNVEFARDVTNMFKDLLNSKGFDGIKYWNTFDSGPTQEQLANAVPDGKGNYIIQGKILKPDWSYIAFAPNQIKSATGNTGSFSPDSNNIYNQDQRGSIQFRSSETVISLFESADRSTFLHESGHFFLQVMQDLGEDVNAPENIKKDWQTILKFLEVESGEQIGTEQHEKWAESFEKYLFEGNAPSTALQDAFRRFKAWLTSVYKQLKNLNVEIDDDIRGIFDRMLATEQEIQEAERAANYMPAFESAEQAGMTESEWKNYQEQANRATREAEDDLDQKKLSELERERKRWWREEREKVSAEVEQEINQMPIYQAIHFLQTGEVLDGELIEGVEPMKLDKKALTDEFGPILGQLPRGKEGVHVKEGGVHHDLVASLFGFESGAAMIQEMIKAKKRQTLIDETTTERMMQTFGDMMSDPQKLKEEALKSAHMADQRGRFLEMELKALSKRANQKGTPANAAREAARDIIGRKKVSQLHVGRLRAAELRAAKAAEKAILKEDWNEAIKQKRNQLLNHYLYREAEKAQTKVDQILRHLNKFQRPGVRKNLSRDYLDQIDTILEKFDLKKSVSLKAIQKRQSFAAWVKLQEANGDQVVITPGMEKLLEAAEKVHYKEMSFEQLLDMDDLVKNIEHLARFKQKLIDGQQLREFREVVGELIGTAEQEHGEWQEDAPDFTNSNWKKTLDFGSRFLGEHEKIEFLARFMDGEKDNGTWWRHIFKPISDAENAEMIMQEEFSRKLNAIFESRYTAEERKQWHKTLMTGHGVFNKRNVIAMALNWGNIENRSAMVEGLQAKFGINEEAVQEILDAHMKQKDWEMVQETLDLINELWPQISAMQRELTGVTPKKVEAEPIVTKYGTYAGGYYPLKYDPKFSHKQEQRSEKEGTQDLLESNWLRPATKKGHTIERVGSGGQMVRLDLGVLSEHVTNVIHDLTHRQAVIQIDRLTQNDQVRAAIEGVAGKEAYRQIRPWLQGVANDHVPLTSNLEKGLAWARHGASIVAMGFKMTTALVQPLGYTQSVVLLGEKWAARGLKNFYRHPLENRDAILKKSVFMRHRMETLDRDIKDSLNRISGEESRMKAMHSKYFAFIGWMDMTVSLPTWQGGYEKALSEGMNEEDAIAHADSMVRQSQAGGGAKDLAAIQRGHEGKKLFTLFYSYFSALFNMQKRTFRMRKEGRISNFEAFRHFVWLVALPAVLSELLLGRAPDDDDDESMAEWTAKTTLTYPFYSIVLVRDLVNYMANPQFGFSLPSADVAEGIGKGIAAIDDIWDDDEEFNEVDVKNMILGLSFALQLPGRQAANMYEHFHEVMEGEDFSLWEFLVKRDRND